MEVFKKVSEENGARIVTVDAAILANYKGLVIFAKYLPKDDDDRYQQVWIGKESNYDNKGHYDNKDDSLEIVSENGCMFSLLSSSGWVLSQQEMVDKGFFTDEDYKELSILDKKLTERFGRNRELLFDQDILIDGSGVPFKYPDYNPLKSRPKSVISKVYNETVKNNPGCMVVLRVGNECQVRGTLAELEDLSYEIKGNLKAEKEGKNEYEKLTFKASEIDDALEKIRAYYPVIYKEISGDELYMPSHYELEKYVSQLEAKDLANKSKEYARGMRERLIEWALREGTNDKDTKLKIYQKSLEEIQDYDLGVYIHDQYEGVEISYSDRQIISNWKGFGVKLIDPFDASIEATFYLDWKSVAETVRRMVDRGTYLSEEEKKMYEKLKEGGDIGKVLGDDPENLDKAIEDMTMAELSALLGLTPKDFVKECQSEIEVEYASYLNFLESLSAKDILDRAREAVFYKDIYDILMTDISVSPLNEIDFRCLYEDTQGTIGELYEFYKEGKYNSTQYVDLIKDYNEKYHSDLINWGREFEIIELRNNLPKDYKEVEIYPRSLKYAQNNNERKLYYQSLELNRRCLRDLEASLRNVKGDEDYLLPIVDKYGKERVNSVVSCAIKNQSRTCLNRFSEDIKNWAKKQTQQPRELQNLIKSSLNPKELEFVAEELSDRDTGVYKKMAEVVQKPVEWIRINTNKAALIRRYDLHSYMQMPRNGKYSGYTYSLYNNRVEMPKDEGEDLTILAASDETIKIYHKKQVSISLPIKEFIKEVEGKNKASYQSSKDVFKLHLPIEAFKAEYENSYLFDMPLNTKYSSRSYFIPKHFVVRNVDGDFSLAIPSDYEVHVKKQEDDAISITAQDFSSLILNNSDYKDKQTDIDKEWLYMSVPMSAKLVTYESTSMFRAPDEESGSNKVYYLPNKMFKVNEDTNMIRISLPRTFFVTIKDAQTDEKSDYTAEEFMEMIKNKNYSNEFVSPSAFKDGNFAEIEANLRANVPEEMKSRNNWVVVRTKYNSKTKRLGKTLINVKTDKFAESDNPETWVSFEEACAYARENKADSIAYALDGKDNICCIDLDGCIEEDKYNDLAIVVDQYAEDTYKERSISGKGLHFFAKTKGLDIRSFSKDGTLEFYQKNHFIAMTGDCEEKKDLMNIDKTPLEKFLKQKCDKRLEASGATLGISGLTSMTDRELLDRAMSSPVGGDLFKRLYEGEDVQNNHSNSDMSLMTRLAFWCNGDKEQMLRIFATSGLYRPNKSPEYYEGTAIKAIRINPDRYDKATAKNFIKDYKEESEDALSK